jgi:EmrB/QacA subfamily drug resistance transporter
VHVDLGGPAAVRSSTDSSYRLTFLVLAVSGGAYALMQNLLSPVLPLLQHDLHTTQSTVTWVFTAFLLSASVFTPILGRVGDMIGKEKALLGVLIVLALGLILGGLSNSIGLMIVARAVQGIGGAVLPLAFGIIRDEFPRQKVSTAVGIISGLAAFGGGVGLILAGPIVDALDYHWLFWIPAIAVGGAAIATHFVVPQSPVRTAGRINALAAVLLSTWLVALLIAVSEATLWGWVSPEVVGLIVGAVVLAVLWVLVELRSEHPLIDMKMMRLPAVWPTNLVALLFGAGLYATFGFVAEFCQTPRAAGFGFGSSITESGLIATPQTIAIFSFGLLSGPMSKRFGARTLLICGAALSVPAFLLMAFVNGQIWQFAADLTLLGVGIGLAFSAMSSVIVDAVPSHQTGVASGMNANIRTIGGAIGSAVMGSIVSSHVTAAGVPTESGYRDGFAVLGGVMVLAAVAAVFIPRTTIVRDAHQREQANLAHAELAIVAGGTIVGDESE